MPVTYKIDIIAALKSAGYNTNTIRKEKLLSEGTLQSLRECKYIYSNPTNYCPIKQESNHPEQSLAEIKLKAVSTEDFKSEADLAFNLRRTDLILDHIFSMGLKSGLYGGKYITLIFNSSISSLTALE